MLGEMIRVIPDLGLGIIRAEDGKEFSFRESALQDGDFARLAKGDAVEFDLSVEEDGAHVRHVRLIQQGVKPSI